MMLALSTKLHEFRFWKQHLFDYCAEFISTPTRWLACNMILMSPWLGMRGSPVIHAKTRRRSEAEASCPLWLGLQNVQSICLLRRPGCRTCMKRQNHTNWTVLALQPSYLHWVNIAKLHNKKSTVSAVLGIQSQFLHVYIITTTAQRLPIC